MDELRLILNPEHTGSLVADIIEKELKVKIGINSRIFLKQFKLTTDYNEVNLYAAVDIYIEKKSLHTVLKKNKIPKWCVDICTKVLKASFVFKPVADLVEKKVKALVKKQLGNDSKINFDKIKYSYKDNIIKLKIVISGITTKEALCNLIERY